MSNRSSGHASSDSIAPARVAYQGEPGAYSECAVIELLGEGVEAVGLESFEAVFRSTVEKHTDLSLVPVENSLGGSIHINFDLMLRYDLSVVAEHSFRVRHCLLVLPGVKREDVTIVYSHPQALAQCDEYIRSWGVDREATYDTAGSAKMIAERGMRGAAAIASRLAARHYGLEVLDEGIEDEKENFTRFLLLRREAVHPGADVPSKTSLVFTPKANVPGALFKAISCFSLRDIDLSKIESRPDKKLAEMGGEDVSGRGNGGAEKEKEKKKKKKEFRPKEKTTSAEIRAIADRFVQRDFNYRFFLDFLGERHSERSANALRHLSEVASYVRILGSYPRDGRLVGLDGHAGVNEMRMVGARSPHRLKRNATSSSSSSVAAPTPAAAVAEGGGGGRLNIAIIGFGNFGQFLATTMRHGHNIYASSRSDYTAVAERMGVVFYRDANELLREAAREGDASSSSGGIGGGGGSDRGAYLHSSGRGIDVVLVCTSVLSFDAVVSSLDADVLRELKPLVVDVLSVKEHAKRVMLSRLPEECDVLCTHPMFGPESGKHGWYGLPFVCERVRLRDAPRGELFIDIFRKQGCRMIDMTCRAHDELAARSQFVTHFTGRLLKRLDLHPTPIDTTGFQSLLKLVDNTCKDSFDLFLALYRCNEHSNEEVDMMQAALLELRRTLEDASGEIDSRNEEWEREKKKKKKEEGDRESTLALGSAIAAAQERDARGGTGGDEAGVGDDSSSFIRWRLSRRVLRMSASATAAVNDERLRLLGEDSTRRILGLNIGEPDYLPPARVIEAMREALAKGDVRYTSIAGTQPLREAISKYYSRSVFPTYHPDKEIIVSNGGKQALFQLFSVICREGDQVIVPSPFWVTYLEQIKLCGAEAVVVRTSVDNAFLLQPEELRQALRESPRARALVLCNPNNPSGTAYTKAQLEALAKVIEEERGPGGVDKANRSARRERNRTAADATADRCRGVARDFCVIADEVYEQLYYEMDVSEGSPTAPSSSSSSSSSSESKASLFRLPSSVKESPAGALRCFASLPGMRERTFTVNSFSKGFAMTGLRVGVVCGPAPVVSRLKTFQSQTNGCVNSVGQAGALEALTMACDESGDNASGGADLVKYYCDIAGKMRKRRDIVCKALGEIPEIKFAPPNAAFYCFPDCGAYLGGSYKTPDGRRITDATSLCKYLLRGPGNGKPGVALVPGDAFGEPRCVRLAFSKSEEEVAEAMAVIKDAFAALVKNA